jgi:hypothetical protein
MTVLPYIRARFMQQTALQTHTIFELDYASVGCNYYSDNTIQRIKIKAWHTFTKTSRITHE